MYNERDVAQVDEGLYLISYKDVMAIYYVSDITDPLSSVKLASQPFPPAEKIVGASKDIIAIINLERQIDTFNGS